MTGNPLVTAMVCYTHYLQNKFGDPRIFFCVFSVILSFSTNVPAVEVLKNLYVGKFLGMNIFSPYFFNDLQSAVLVETIYPFTEVLLRPIRRLTSHSRLSNDVQQMIPFANE